MHSAGIHHTYRQYLKLRKKYKDKQLTVCALDGRLLPSTASDWVREGGGPHTPSSNSTSSPWASEKGMSIDLNEEVSLLALSVAEVRNNHW